MSDKDDANTQRIDKLEGHVNNIYSEVSTLKESGARVEASQSAMGNDITFLVNKYNEPAQKTNIVGWLGITAMAATMMSSLLFAVLSPMKTEDSLTREWIKHHQDREIDQAFYRGREVGELDATQADLKQLNAKVRAMESAMKRLSQKG